MMATVGGRVANGPLLRSRTLPPKSFPNSLATPSIGMSTGIHTCARPRALGWPAVSGVILGREA